MRNLTLIAGALILAAASSSAVAANADLVTNGNFSQGNTGFTSTFHYNSQTDPGAYYINAGADHTTGTGNYMVPDAGGSGDPVAKNQYFWQETFTVLQNSTYSFTAYVRLTDPSPTLVATVNGAEIARSTLASYDWTAVTANWNSGASTSATLSLFNANSAYSDNDFFIDDISFVGPSASAGTSAAPEPASWAMMVGGFGLLGAAMRRRREIDAAVLIG